MYITKQVNVGGVLMGGGAPVTIQSMTNTDTADIEATVGQIKALEKEGCEIVRLSVYNIPCANGISKIKEKINIPLVADIHFDYKLAILSAENGVDKLRINPGNIGEKSHVQILADCAKAHKIPIRIGVNAGSLEKELLKVYGKPTPGAMVKSAIQHVKLLESCGFYDIVISLKASNVKDTVEAYRLLKHHTDYPMHIGITEAGRGEMALIKSAIGIGSLLLEGLGDTIRVSITGDPIEEVRAAKKILSALSIRRQGVEIISCPTCGRCNVQLEEIVKDLEKRLPKSGKPVTIAVMGCAVNGPGEAKEADLGIAFGDGIGVLFKKGVKIKSGDVKSIVDQLVQETIAMV